MGKLSTTEINQLAQDHRTKNKVISNLVSLIPQLFQALDTLMLFSTAYFTKDRPSALQGVERKRQRQDNMPLITLFVYITILPSINYTSKQALNSYENYFDIIFIIYSYVTTPTSNQPFPSTT